jgi:hypothetical protein
MGVVLRQDASGRRPAEAQHKGDRPYLRSTRATVVDRRLRIGGTWAVAEAAMSRLLKTGRLEKREGRYSLAADGEVAA